MATFHISFKKLRRSEGKSSVYLSAYQNREKTIDNRTGQPGIIQKKRDFSALLSSPLPAHLPNW
ncbi:hypothetical protein ACKUSN_24825 [Enterobacter roggenkampii]